MLNTIKSLLRQLRSLFIEDGMDNMTLSKHLQAGRVISEEKAEELEEAIQKDPSNLIVRARLVGYYTSNKYKDENCKNGLSKHILWIIENIPEHCLASTSESHFYPTDRDYETGKEAWRMQVEAKRNNVEVLQNAATYMFMKDKELAESYLLAGKRIDPLSPKWPNRLSDLYCELASNSPEYWKKALEEKKEAFQKACFFGLKDGLDELLQLPYLARNAGDNGQAANYAAMLLTHARSIKDDTKKAKCIHEAKNVLGLLAYDRGNYEAASDLLLESVSLDRELLRDLHPRLKLAKLLLKQGLTSEVSTFAYKFTDRFGEKVLQRWQLDIRAGKIPSDW